MTFYVYPPLHVEGNSRVTLCNKCVSRNLILRRMKKLEISFRLRLTWGGGAVRFITITNVLT